MSKEMIISSSPQETRVAILEDDQLVEVHIERSQEQGLVGSIYKGRVTKVLPGMQSAFVNVGLERDAFLYVSDFFEDAEEYDSIVATVEDKIEKLDTDSLETADRLPTPAIIEIPTIVEPVAAAPAMSTPLPPIAESAVTTQPPQVSEKAAEAEARQEKNAPPTPASASPDPAQRPHNEFDQQGRYSRRRGRRRPWERRREEQQRSSSLTPAPPSVKPPESAPPAPVVNTLTPLPGESLSKFQSGAGAVGETPPAAPIVAPAGTTEATAEVASTSVAEESAPAVPAPLAEATFEAAIPKESVAQPGSVVVERTDEHAPEPTVTPGTAPPKASAEEEPTKSGETTEPVAETTSRAVAASTEEGFAKIEEPAALLRAEVEMVAQAESTLSVSAELVEPPVVEPPAPEKTEAPTATIDHLPEAKLETLAQIPTTSVPVEKPAIVCEATQEAIALTGATISSSEAPRETTLKPSAAVPSEISFAEGEGPASASETALLGPETAPSTVERIHAEESALAAAHKESDELRSRKEDSLPEGSVEPAVSPVVQKAVVDDVRTAEPAEVLTPSAPVAPESSLAQESLKPAVPPISQAPAPAVPAVVASPTNVASETPKVSALDRKREEVPRFEKRTSRKERFAERKFEKFERKSGPFTPPPAPQPEVYGPPTPYQFMTSAEKAEYNARRAQEKASAKIVDSSHKLTAPQSRERDYGYTRGRRSRRGRKRFGERESHEELPTLAPREEKRTAARPLITDLLREGQEILVQIAKEPIGKKGARITSHIALPGRYLVYMPTVDHIGVSRKIASDEERHRLKRVLNEHRAGLPGGFIVRTAGEGRSEEELKQDIRFLANTWADIRARAEKRAAPALLHRDLGVLERILRDQLSSEFTAIRIDNETEYTKVLEFVNQFQPSLIGRVKLHFKDTPIFEEYGIDHEIEKALKPKVWLKSGGYVVINQTEAMVAIDVNTGKFVGKTTRLEDTIVKTNIDAAKEVARQVRLRDMGGIIVIDFIDMEERKNRQKVIQALEEAMRRDRAPSKILAFNDFGLVALTRKRVKQSLEKTLLQPCAYCQGHGMIKSVQTVCYEIQAEAKKMAPLLDGREIRIRVHPDVAKVLKTSEQSVINEIEAHTRKEVAIKTDPQAHQDQFEIY
jgi:Rne/Rng family ribonuclease